MIRVLGAARLGAIRGRIQAGGLFAYPASVLTHGVGGALIAGEPAESSVLARLVGASQMADLR